jgi:hypothetical protein
MVFPRAKPGFKGFINAGGVAAHLHPLNLLNPLHLLNPFPYREYSHLPLLTQQHISPSPLRWL